MGRKSFAGFLSPEKRKKDKKEKHHQAKKGTISSPVDLPLPYEDAIGLRSPRPAPPPAGSSAVTGPAQNASPVPEWGGVAGPNTEEDWPLRAARLSQQSPEQVPQQAQQPAYQAAPYETQLNDPASAQPRPTTPQTAQEAYDSFRKYYPPQTVEPVSANLPRGHGRTASAAPSTQPGLPSRPTQHLRRAATDMPAAEAEQYRRAEAVARREAAEAAELQAELAARRQAEQQAEEAARLQAQEAVRREVEYQEARRFYGADEELYTRPQEEASSAAIRSRSPSPQPPEMPWTPRVVAVGLSTAGNQWLPVAPRSQYPQLASGDVSARQAEHNREYFSRQQAALSTITDLSTAGPSAEDRHAQAPAATVAPAWWRPQSRGSSQGTVFEEDLEGQPEQADAAPEMPLEHLRTPEEHRAEHYRRNPNRWRGARTVTYPSVPPPSEAVDEGKGKKKERRQDGRRR